MTGSVAEGMNFKLWDPYTTKRGGKGPDDGLYIDLLYHSGTDLFEMLDPPPSGVAAMQYDAGTYKVVFTTISFAALIDSTPSSTKTQLIENIINWFVFPTLVEWDDHDTGNVVFTVTNKGACGYTQTNMPFYGSGFVYPADGTSQLYHGSICAGNSQSYCVDSYYDSPHDWSALEGVWSSSTIPPSGMPADQTFYAKYDDSGHSTPKGLSIIQDSWSWNYPTLIWDFVIIRYTLINEGTESIDSLYVGQLMDWNVGDYISNQGGVDPNRNLAYMWDNSDPSSVYVGVSLLEPDTPRNLALIDHDLHVYPFDDFPDSIMIAFLNGSLNDTANMRDYDWSMCVSAGPFSLAPGESVAVAFAIVGGDNLDDLQFNVDLADSAYWYGVGVYEGNRFSNKLRLVLRNVPNPLKDYTTIVYEIPTSSHITLNIYDASGKAVRNLVNGWRDRGIWRIEWNGKDGAGRRLSSGVYFLRLEGDNFRLSDKLILLK